MKIIVSISSKVDGVFLSYHENRNIVNEIIESSKGTSLPFLSFFFDIATNSYLGKSETMFSFKNLNSLRL